MNVIDIIGRGLLACINLIRAVGKTIAYVFTQRGPGADREARETERLDRIRNPSKYRGKEI
jgi:hypothetical protein